jgi:RNA polymerase sigma factor (sigma-70 family)
MMERFPMSDSDSTTGDCGAKDTHSPHFFSRLNRISPSAADELFNRYWERLCRQVGFWLDERLARREDPEDVAQSTLRSLFRGIAEGRFRFDGSDSLGAMLKKIARGKILKHAEYHRAEKRHPQYEVYGGDDNLLTREPTAEEVAELADAIEWGAEGLQDLDRQVYYLVLLGHSRSEIAKQVDKTEGSVRCVIDRCKARLANCLGDSPAS